MSRKYQEGIRQNVLHHPMDDFFGVLLVGNKHYFLLNKSRCKTRLKKREDFDFLERTFVIQTKKKRKGKQNPRRCCRSNGIPASFCLGDKFHRNDDNSKSSTGRKLFESDNGKKDDGLRLPLPSLLYS